MLTSLVCSAWISMSYLPINQLFYFFFSKSIVPGYRSINELLPLPTDGLQTIHWPSIPCVYVSGPLLWGESSGSICANLGFSQEQESGLLWPGKTSYIFTCLCLKNLRTYSVIVLLSLLLKLGTKTFFSSRYECSCKYACSTQTPMLHPAEHNSDLISRHKCNHKK